ncbi:mini-chromosome maintenance complex-binding protein-like [Babylonia areolata]|uniref:mini-chromosome maintenance complex-binding protein-like n=1 Tax=Babylonia areolata TaxID=304850 RepID=UPI003FD54ED8
MPGVENWIDKPLQVIQSIINRLPADTKEIDGVKEYFAKQLKSAEALAWVPSINCHALHKVGADSLVRYRCMVQDMFDPELYLACYQVTSRKTGEVTQRSGHYRDVASCTAGEQIHVDDPNNITGERQTLYCVPVPGESSWVKSVYAKQCNVPSTPSTSNSPVSRKRARDEDNGEGDGGGEVTNGNHSGHGSISPQNRPVANGDQQAAAAASANVASPLPDLNFPLPGEKGPACLVKVYGDGDALKVNDMIEVVGILSVDPSLAEFSSDQDEQDMAMSAAERAVHTPPPSLVPRLHAVLIQKMTHNNPFLPQDLTGQHQAVMSVQGEAEAARRELLSVLEQAVFGDQLAAEFLLCHLISSVYARADVMPLGKLAVNLVGPATKGLAPFLHQLIAALTTQSHLLPISLSNMNTLRLCPHKDYEVNRLRSGQLQLTSGTHLVLDETALQNGQLDTQGVNNVTALGNVIQWQKVTYDFQYHTQDFITDLPVLVLSEGESFLPKDIHLPLRPTSVPADLDAYYTELSARLTDDLLNKLRAFITVCRGISYSVNEDIQNALQEEFVTARKNDPSAMSISDFHCLLSLVRLSTLSHCQSDCSPQILNRVLEMDRLRRARTSPSAAAN